MAFDLFTHLDGRYLRRVHAMLVTAPIMLWLWTRGVAFSCGSTPSCAAGSRGGPRNAFPYVPAAGYLFIAGGIGITPIPPMVKQAAASGTPWQLVYTGRSRGSMPFLDELSALDPAGCSSACC